MSLAEALEADEIVVPDRLGATDETLKQAAKFEKHVIDGFNYMGVLQGRNMSEVLKCLNGFRFRHPWINVIGIPRVLLGIDINFRVNLLNVMGQILEPEEMTRYQFHCLGAGEHLREPVMLATTIARSIDTSLPVVMGLAYKDIRSDPYTRRPHDFFERDADRAQREYIDHNVDTYLDWAGAQASEGEM